MHKIGVKGKFLQIIKSMYGNINSCIQVTDGLCSEFFKSNKGIMQGDSLSPLLFNTFMNDIPNFLKISNCPGVTLANKSINCLMFADDLVLMSSSANGLQKSINSMNSNTIEKWRQAVRDDPSQV